MKKLKILILLGILLLANSCGVNEGKAAKEIVMAHARAWETGDYELLNSILHEDAIFAYPGRRLSKNETLNDFLEYNMSFRDTKIYVNKVIAVDDDVAVEWQFASTNVRTGNRSAVSDAIIGRIKDGKIIVWKEYLDGRVSRMQASGNLSLDEGEEPFPWPAKK